MTLTYSTWVGNVSEWVFDTYRALSYGDFDDLNPVRKDGTGDSEANYGWESSQVTDSISYNPQSRVSLIS